MARRLLPGKRRRRQDRAAVLPPVNRAIQRLADRKELRRGALGGQQQAAMVQAAAAADLQAAQGETAQMVEDRQMVPVWPDHPDRPLMAFAKIAKASGRQAGAAAPWYALCRPWPGRLAAAACGGPWALGLHTCRLHVAMSKPCPSFLLPPVQWLKPHQREGLQFMWDSLVLDFETVSGRCCCCCCCCCAAAAARCRCAAGPAVPSPLLLLLLTAVLLVSSHVAALPLPLCAELNCVCRTPSMRVAASWRTTWAWAR